MPPEQQESDLDRVRVNAGLVGAAVDLADIRLVELNVRLLDPSAQPPFSFTLEVVPGVQHDAGLAVFEFEYLVKVQSGTTEDPFAEMSVKYALIYTFPQEVSLAEVQFRDFGQMTVYFVIYPYVREILQDMTSRMGLPPLTLPMVKSPFHENPRKKSKARAKPVTQ